MTVKTEPDRPAQDLEMRVARMISEWEVSDDLASDLAGRIVAVCREEFGNKPFGNL